MNLNNHLIYIDITQICGIGCEFCMYSDKHTIKDHLILTEKAKENISQIINHKEVKRVSVSGEGEPLNNIKAFIEILELSKGGISFEFITSGNINHDKLIEFYKDINNILSKNKDVCNIRLSTDSYHIKKIKYFPHAISLKYFFDHNLQNLTFSFRSIDIDKEFTRNYLKNELSLLNITSNIIINTVLDDKIIINNKSFQIDYKNLVKPVFVKNIKYMTLTEYIQAQEKRYKKDFTLGSMNLYPSSNGIDLTIKPNGDTYFYGIDSVKLGNIHSDNLTIEILKDIINKDKLIYTLHTIPFLKLMDKISINDNIRAMINRANNPYWIIKEIISYDKSLLEKLIEN